LRGGYGAEASEVVYNNACACDCASTDASNKGSGLGSFYTDADGACLAGQASGAGSYHFVIAVWRQKRALGDDRRKTQRVRFVLGLFIAD
jgi:hypothetical protein